MVDIKRRKNGTWPDATLEVFNSLPAQERKRIIQEISGTDKPAIDRDPVYSLRMMKRLDPQTFGRVAGILTLLNHRFPALDENDMLELLIAISIKSGSK